MAKAKKNGRSGRSERPEQQGTMVLDKLEQIRVLADPLRVKILEALCLEERTTKQVAERIGEKPTRLYHHVEALEKVGLIRMTRTRQNRGTLEKYYFGVARRFEASSELFSEAEAGGGEGQPLPTVIGHLIERTGDELRQLLASPAAGELKERGVLTFCEVNASEADLVRIQRRLERLVKDLTKLDDDPPEDARRFRLTLAFYPLDRG